MQETEVMEAVITYLTDRGYKISPETRKRHGIDIKAYHNNNGTQYIIEAKGDTKGGSAARHIDFHTCVGQILTRMTRKSDTTYYALAFPISWKKYTEKIPERVRKLLKLKIMLVDDTKNVSFV